MRLNWKRLSNTMQVVDTRSGKSFASGHVPGTLNIPYNSKFVTWAGWLLDFDHDIAVIAESRLLEDIQTDLQSIGLDRFVTLVDIADLSPEQLTEQYPDWSAEQAVEAAEAGEVVCPRCPQ